MKIKRVGLFIVGCLFLVIVCTPIPGPASEKFYFLALGILILRASLSFPKAAETQDRQPIASKDRYPAALEAAARVRKSFDNTAKLPITLTHVEIYQRYGGDIDGWLIMKRDSERSMSSGVWSLIGSLIQDLNLIQSGNASASFEKTTLDRLQASCENEETMRQLIEFSKTREGRASTRFASNI